MPYIDSNAIEEAKQIDLKTYLEVFEPQELVRVSGKTYCTRTHDSLRIFPSGDWYWFSQGFGGRSALDFLIKVRGMKFVEAVETLVGKQIVIPPKEQFLTEEKKEFVLPEKNETAYKASAYLKGRGIDSGIINYCINRELIYESAPYRNVVFVGKDKEGVPRYAVSRATNKNRFMRECPGSDKRFSFRINGDKSNSSVHVFESAIDLLSYATIAKKKLNYHWADLNYLSLGGVAGKGKTPSALQNFLESKPNVKTIYLHLDADKAGRDATEAIQKVLGDKYTVIDSPPPCGKDFNDYLCAKYPPPQINYAKKYRDEAR